MREAILHAIVQCSAEVGVGSVGLWRTSVSDIIKGQLSAESTLKIDPSDFLTKGGKHCFLVVVAMAREIIRKSRTKRLMRGNFISSPSKVK